MTSRPVARPSARRRWAVPAWCLLLAVVALAPVLLGRGYVLSYDMVVVPQQTWSWAMLGLGGGPPRAVPQDAVTAAVSWALPGVLDLVQKAVLVATLAAAGAGAAALLGGRSIPARLAAATLYAWSAYVAERLVLGHWSLLVAYAVLPWALVAAGAVRRGVPGARSRLVLLLALAGLTPTGGLLVALVAVPAALVARPWRRGVPVLAGAVAVNAPWWVAGLLAGAGTSSAEGARAFALRAEGPWGSVLTALGTGGVWNAQVVPGSRGSWVAPAAALVVAVLAALGLPALARRLGRAVALGLLAAALVGLGWCLLGAWGPTEVVVDSVVTAVPGAGLLRDAQKWLAPLALLLAVAAPLGLARGARRVRDVRPVLLGVLVVLPIVALPDLAWGVAGRLHPVVYPESYAQVRAGLSLQAPGDVLLLPWASYRAYGWNELRPSLSIVPRGLGRPVVADDDLVVGVAGADVHLGADDPRAAAAAPGMADGDVCAAARAAGASYVLVEGPSARVPACTVTVLTAGDLTLAGVPGPVAAWPEPGPCSRALLLVGYAAAVGAVLVAVVGRVRGRRSRRRA